MRMADCHPDRPHSAKGLCRRCDQAQRRRAKGRPEMPAIESPLARAERQIDRSGGPEACHPWLGSTSKGTPIFTVRKAGYNARRVIHEATLGTKLPTEQRVRDMCGNAICCNPKHLKGGSLADRLEAQIDKNGPTVRPELGPCWVWTGYSLKGYGRLRERRGTPWVFAHRLAYNLAYGVELPKEVLVMHRCDNPPCCNPAHLRPGTNAENIADMWSKGRGSSGENARKAMRNAKALREAGYVKEHRPPGRPKKRTAA